MFFFKSYVASYGYVRRPGTDRIPEGVPKKFLRNRNRDSCEKSATGEENTGILRISTGITNPASRHGVIGVGFVAGPTSAGRVSGWGSDRFPIIPNWAFPGVFVVGHALLHD